MAGLGDEAKTMQLMNLTAGNHSYNAILNMVKKHPQRHDVNVLAEEILSGNFNENDWIDNDDNSLTESSTDSNEHMEEKKEIIEKDEDETITDQLLVILGDMYDRNKVLEIVKNHPDKYNVEIVMDSVLDSINIETVDGQWLRNASNGIKSMLFFF